MLKIAILEDNPRYQVTIAIILQLDPRLQLIHRLNSCEEMIGRFEVDTPDVVLMDIDMPGMSGIEGVWTLKRKWPDLKVLMLTVFEDEDKIFGAIKAGANGYLLKKDSPQKILESIHAVVQGESPMNGLIASKVLDYFQQQAHRALELEEANLTRKEKEILELLIKGFSYKELASQIYISIETLNTHIKNIYRKLNVHSRSELAARFGGR